jgi:uncharacterized protein (TIGR03067 family)
MTCEQGVGTMISALLLLSSSWFSLPFIGDASSTDLLQLQGEWVLVRMEVGGKEVPADRLASATVRVEGRHYRLTTRNMTFDVEIRLDAHKSPKEIDMTFLNGPNQDRTGKGIYKLERHRWTICRSVRPEDDRPREFSSEEVNYFIMVWERK